MKHVSWILLMLIYAQSSSAQNSIQPIEKVYKVVEDMPRFPGCHEGTDQQIKHCADKKMLEFLYKNIKHPPKARENGIIPTVVVYFIVDKKGHIRDAKVIKGHEGGFGAEVLHVINSMPDWVPGMQDGACVHVEFKLPVKICLQ